MAKVLGNPGRYVSQQSVKKYRRFILSALGGIALLSFLYGGFFVYELFLGRKTLIVSMLSTAAFLLLIFLIGRIVTRRMNTYEKERINFLKGATGEQTVAKKIDDLPDEFCVIHDMATPFGNLDHVVIGSTGVFVLETKNWKGVITADGRGGILLNGHSQGKDTIKPMTSRMMKVRDKINMLCDADGELPFFNALLVFPSARVEAKWGQTRKVRCITDEYLWDCIVEAKVERRLQVAEVERLASAFKALASMDKEFFDTAEIKQ
jgi:hypothetical protein